MVLVHPHRALSPGPFRSLIQTLPRLLLCFLSYLLVASLPAVTAQNLNSGQPPTGLSVLASPPPNTVLKAGDIVSVEVDVSEGTNRGFAYTSLEIYLVSALTNANVTVAAGPQLLAQDPGSTVKRVQWPVATCLATGDYNLTVYEASTFNGAGFFAIMPVPVQVQNDRDRDVVCSSPVNPLQTQPQPSNPPPLELLASPTDLPSTSSSLETSASESIISDPGPSQTSLEPVDSTSVPSSGSVDSTSVPSSDASTSTSDVSATTTPPPESTLTSAPPQETEGGGIITVTAGDGEITIPLSDLPGTIVVEPSGGAPPNPSTSSTSGTESSGFITVFRTVTPTATATLTEVISQPVTITLEETFVSTETAPGETREVTVTQTLLSTTQVVTTPVTSPDQAGLLPVNGAVLATPSFAVSMCWALSFSAFFHVFRSLFAL